jgi:hypothetical protein
VSAVIIGMLVGSLAGALAGQFVASRIRPPAVRIPPVPGFAGVPEPGYRDASPGRPALPIEPDVVVTRPPSLWFRQDCDVCATEFRYQLTAVSKGQFGRVKCPTCGHAKLHMGWRA